ncbi:hypothetical protein PC119_g6974 [Phytophthora cactorum]|nr:hypothetical protein PC119_g6974 [Phytophthora cactorum]
MPQRRRLRLHGLLAPRRMMAVYTQAEAREKFQETKEKRSSALRSKAAKYATPSGSVRINGLIEVAYIPDTGADKSIIPQGVVESLHAVQPLLSSTLLRTNMEVVMADGRRLVCDQEVLLDLERMTIAGPVSIRSVPCLVLSGGGDEVLLGRDVLKGLGIDVEEQLAQLASPLSLDRDMGEFPAGDGIPDPQDAQEPITILSQLLDRAVANGLPTEHVDAVRDLLELFPDVWRAAVGPDPPAKVEPLRVTLKFGAVPYRSPPRKYAPLQAQFIREYVKSLVDNGLMEQNDASRWACAVVPVRKPGTSDKFRLTIDYRPINSMTVPIAGAIPRQLRRMNPSMTRRSLPGLTSRRDSSSCLSMKRAARCFRLLHQMASILQQESPKERWIRRFIFRVKSRRS